MDLHPLTVIGRFPTWLVLPRELAAKVAEWNKAAEAVIADKAKVAAQADAVAVADPVTVDPDAFAAVRRGRIANAQAELRLRRELPELVDAIRKAAQSHWKPAFEAAEKIKADIRKKVEAIGFVDTEAGWWRIHPAVREANAHAAAIRDYGNSFNEWLSNNREGARVTEERLRQMLNV